MLSINVLEDTWLIVQREANCSLISVIIIRADQMERQARNERQWRAD